MRYDVAYPPSPWSNVTPDVEKYINNKKSANMGRRPTPKKKQGKKSPQVRLARVVKNSLGQALQSSFNGPSNLTKQKVGMVDGNIALSECAAKLAIAIANPWSPKAAGACLPTAPTRNSQKVTSFMRFDAVVGTNGYGYCLISPALASDANYAYATTATYNGTAGFVPTPITSTSVATFSMGNIPYTSADMWQNVIESTGSGSYVQGRLCSVGVSASYTGTTLNESGLMVCFASPSHDDLTRYSFTALQDFSEADVTNVSRNKCWLSSTNVSPSECQYERTTEANAISAGNPASAEYQMACIYPWSQYLSPDVGTVGADLWAGTCPMAIHFSGTPGNIIHFEIVQHAEYIGRKTEGKTTASVADPKGLADVMSAANRIPALKQANPHKHVGSLMLDALRLVQREIRPVAENFLVSALGALML